jgi:RNA polymerase sigma factor (sigma-70 family)
MIFDPHFQPQKSSRLANEWHRQPRRVPERSTRIYCLHREAVGMAAFTTAGSASLANRIRAGDRSAETEFAERFSHQLLLVLMKQTRDPDIARDCCQKTLLIALTKMRSGEVLRPASLMAFLRCTAANVVITHFRTERRYTCLGDRVFILPGASDNDATHSLDDVKARSLIDATLDELPVRRDREILRRHYLEDEEKLVTCRDFDIKPEHYDRVLYRARNRLRDILERRGRLKARLLGYLDREPAPAIR